MSERFNKLATCTTQSLAHMVIHKEDELSDLREKCAELQRKLDGYEQAAKQAIWQPLTGFGQIREGMKIRFALSGKTVSATAKLILRAGTDREEVVYNRAKNHYFITSMAMDGTSAHKSIEFLSSPNLPAIIEQAKVEEEKIGSLQISSTDHKIEPWNI